MALMALVTYLENYVIYTVYLVCFYVFILWIHLACFWNQTIILKSFTGSNLAF